MYFCLQTRNRTLDKQVIVIPQNEQGTQFKAQQKAIEEEQQKVEETQAIIL
jgi:hypothetical protein